MANKCGAIFGAWAQMVKSALPIWVYATLSCSTTKKYIDYKDFNSAQLKEEKHRLVNEQNYFKVEYVLKRIKNGESHYSLRQIKDKELKGIMEQAPSFFEDKKNWKENIWCKKKFS